MLAAVLQVSMLDVLFVPHVTPADSLLKKTTRVFDDSKLPVGVSVNDLCVMSWTLVQDVSRSSAQV